jgi:hypothetical protein
MMCSALTGGLVPFSAGVAAPPRNRDTADLEVEGEEEEVRRDGSHSLRGSCSGSSSPTSSSSSALSLGRSFRFLRLRLGRLSGVTASVTADVEGPDAVVPVYRKILNKVINNNSFPYYGLFLCPGLCCLEISEFCSQNARAESLKRKR